MRYGHFDDERREYVITRPDTPLPWINYLGSEDYFGIISNTAGGYSFYRDARLRRLTRYRYNNAPLDIGGRYLYLRDDATRRLLVAPAGSRPSATSRTTPAGTAWATRSSRSTLRGHPRPRRSTSSRCGETLEVWRAAGHQRARRRRRTLSLFSSVEFCLWDAQDDATNFQRNYSIGEVEVEDGVIYHKTEYRERRDHFAYFACSEPLAGFDTAARRVPRPVPRLGSAARRRAGRVVQLDRPRLAADRARTTSASSSAPGETTRGHLPARLRGEPAGRQVRPAGLADDRQAARPADRSRATCEPAAVPRRPSRRCGTRWTELLGTCPGADAGTSTSTGWSTSGTPTSAWSRSTCRARRRSSSRASAAGWGSATRTRTCSGFVHMVPARARERLLDIAATQLPTGGAYHQYQPLTKRGNDDVGSGFNDDPLWLVLAVAAYLKETGDCVDPRRAGALRQRSPAPRRRSTSTSSAAIRYTLERLGPARAAADRPRRLERLPEPELLLGDARASRSRRPRTASGGVAESVFIAGLFVLAAGELAAIADAPGRRRRGGALPVRPRRRCATRWTQHGWDGAWFRRAYDYFGRPVGSAENDEGQIFIEPQGMCVMAGIGLDDGRARRALDSVRGAPGDAARDRRAPAGVLPLPPAPRRDLLVPAGLQGERRRLLPHQPVDHDRRDAGSAAATRPSTTTCGSTRRPARRSARSTACEPYVYAQMIAGRDARDPGRGEELLADRDGGLELRRRSASGSSGIRPEHDGLRIDPCVPGGLGRLHGHARFRGATYRIAVRKAPGTAGRVTRLRRRRSRSWTAASPPCPPRRDGDRGRGVRRGGAVTVGRRVGPTASPYGYLDAATREYVITRPDTPRPGSTTSARAATAGSSPTPPAATRSTATRGAGASRATATTRSRPTSPGATSTCATRRPGASGARPGSPSRATSTATNAGTAPATRASGARSTGSRRAPLLRPAGRADGPAPASCG